MPISQKLYVRMISELHNNWEPHDGQIKIGRALFNDNCKSIFVRCGRKFGKTEIAIYLLSRWAFQNPGQGCFYIAPELKQARKLIWQDPRLFELLPKSWIEKTNHSEMCVYLINGSRIIIDGSDNYESHRGTRPGILIYEEYKDHRPEFRMVMRPNMAVYNAPEIFIGTPPETEEIDEDMMGSITSWKDVETNFNMRLEDIHPFILTEVEHRIDSKKYFIHADSFSNPHISREWLDEEKQRLIDRGESDVWDREYLALYRKSKVSGVFPMVNDSFIIKHDTLMNKLRSRMKALEFYNIVDPGTQSVCAALFFAVDRTYRKIYILDEIYETDPIQTATRNIGKRLIQKKQDLAPHAKWHCGRDSAAAWFEVELLNNFEDEYPVEEIYYGAISKATIKNEQGIGAIKDLFLTKCIEISDRCVKTVWELKNRKRVKGKLEGPDHTTDCLIYGQVMSNFFVNMPRPKTNDIVDPDLNPRFRTIEHDVYESKSDDGVRENIPY